MLRRVYDWVLVLAAGRLAPVWLGVVAFVESSFFPVPPDALLLPMALARPERAYWFALICTVASVLGGMLGYILGYAFYDQVAPLLGHLFDLETAKRTFDVWFAEYGVWVILIKGLIPIIPYKLVTITAGATHFDFKVFVAASIVTRGARFFLIAWLIRRYGAPAQAFIEQRLVMVTTVSAASIFGIVLLVRHL